MPLWTFDEVIAATGGRASACAAAVFNGISIDSREIGSSDLFVAIQGDRFDGHGFVQKAIENGAAAALVCAEWAENAPKDLPLIIVDDPLVGLGDLAAAARARTAAKVVAVTGSVGKTSTKEAIRLVLEVAGKTHASIRSFNNHWGVPLMLARMPRETEFGVFEVGMNHADEIRPLVKLIRPHVAVVTNVGEAHLENFDSVADIAAAKAEIFEGLELNSVAILGVDHTHVAKLQEQANAFGAQSILTVGKQGGADFCVTEVRSEETGVTCTLNTDYGDFTLRVPQFGEHALINGAVAFAVASEFGVKPRAIVETLSTFVAPKGRGEVISLDVNNGEATLFDESYNANPISMRSALQVMQDISTSGKKIAVLGDMLELGEHTAKFHAELAPIVLQSGVTKLFLVGPIMSALAAELAGKLDVSHHKSTANIVDLLGEGLAQSDVVMVKGSNGIGLGLIVEQLRTRFSTQ